MKFFGKLVTKNWYLPSMTIYNFKKTFFEIIKNILLFFSVNINFKLLDLIYLTSASYVKKSFKKSNAY